MADIFGTSGDDTIFGTSGNDFIDALGGSDQVYAGVGNDIVHGGAGNDSLRGEDGADQLYGGDGNDTLYIDANDTVVQGGNGIDNILISSFSPGVTLDLFAATAEEAFGGSGNDVIYSTGSIAVRIDGYNGDDTITGGGGNDTLFGNNGNDVVNGGAGNDTIYGSSGNDILQGGGGNDFLNGETGVDTVYGGDGNDTIYIDPSDTFHGGAGFDQVYAYVGGPGSLNVDLGQAEVEGIVASGSNDIIYTTGSGSISAYGSAGNDQLTGGIGNDYLDGGVGNDLIAGGAGADQLHGGDGDDTMYADAQDTVINGGAGIDTLFVQGPTGVTMDVGSMGIEVMHGSEGHDTISTSYSYAVSLQISGQGGNDTITGGIAGDQLAGGDGDDILRGGAVNHAFGGVGNDTLDGGNGDDQLFGEGGDDALLGGEGNDLLDGGTGSDAMAGGAGDDTYVVDDVNDVVTELNGEGSDTVQTSLTYSLAADLENLTLTGTGSVNATGNSLNNVLAGNSANNVLTGGDGNDTIYGGGGNDVLVGGVGNDFLSDDLSGVTSSGNDRLDGGSGADYMSGGEGNDTYVVDDVSDVVVEEFTAGASDTVESSISHILTASIENLTLTGSANIAATGNNSWNMLIGNSGDNVIDGKGGVDTMVGGAGNDIYTVDVSGDVVSESINEGVDTVNSSSDYVLGANVENLNLMSGASSGQGNSLDNMIIGNNVSNVLIGGAGADILDGGAGDDLFLVDNQDTVIGGAGIDTVQMIGLGGLTFDAALGGVEAVYGGLNDDTLSNSGIGIVRLYGGEGNDVLTSGNANDSLYGGAEADILNGNDGNDQLYGDAGADQLHGGGGDDYFVIDAQDTVVDGGQGFDVLYVSGSNGVTLDLGQAQIERVVGSTGADTFVATGVFDVEIWGGGNDDQISGGQGNDTLYGDLPGAIDASGLDMIDGGDGADILVGGAENDVLQGGDGNDILYGDGNFLALGSVSGDDILNGGAGNDFMMGGAGNDIYVVDNIADGVSENANEGIDTVQSSVSYTLSADVENLILTGSAVINATGNALNNTLAGNSAANVLYGGVGVDSMVGGAGDDTYIVDNSGDAITELANEGTDTVLSSTSYTLSADVEHLTLTGLGAINGTGNVLDNQLIGNQSVNVLSGGAGNDTYTVGLGDTVLESVNQGADTVLSSVDFTLGANVENLTLTGTALIHGTGNDLDNTLIGNTNSNVLDGKAGADLLIGGLGDDVYMIDEVDDTIVEHVTEGIDEIISSIDCTLGANMEHLSLEGVSGLNGTGNELSNRIRGNAADNRLDGQGGIDFFWGWEGNDTFIVDDAGDHTIEQAGQGIDTVESTVTFTLQAHVENLTLMGTASTNGNGNELDNILIGNSGNNALLGGTGQDVMIGGAGHDIYHVDNIGDVVTEQSNEGADSVSSAISYALTANVEYLSLMGGTSPLNATGNILHNGLSGNNGDNILDGGLGADSMNGNQGNDSYVVDNTGDVVTENANEGIDTVQSSITYTLGTNVENLTLIATGVVNGSGNDLNNTLLGNVAANILDGSAGADSMAGGQGDDTYLVDNAGDFVIENINEGTDTVQSSITYILGANVENLTLSGTGGINGTGNSLNNTLLGNAAANILDGSAGADSMTGGQGDDIYVVDNASDLVTEHLNEGTDTVQSSLTYALGANVENLTLTGTAATNAIGNGLSNTLTGNSGANTLDGGADVDVMIGGAGDDSYVIDANGEVVIEAANEGIDTVQSSVGYSLTEHVENLTLTGSNVTGGIGNALSNMITGNSATNVIDGGVGADTMSGGLGDDTYVVDDAGDHVIEYLNEGFDTVNTSISYVLGNNVEKVILAGLSAINGTGNALNNTLVGNSAANVLDGGIGTDTMIGGAGNDTYVVDTIGDVVTENANEGTDVVSSSISYILGNNLENLALTGIANLGATGNILNNNLQGNSGSNVMDGGVGADTMLGGQGDDIYVVDNVDDVVTESLNEGIDAVQSSITYTLGANVENLTLIGTSAVNGTGNALDNVLIGNSSANTLTGGVGNDMLNGGVGNDTLVGGTGNDTYVVDVGGDVVTELANEGTDLVQSAVTYTLGTNVENLTLTGATAINGTGNALDNVLIGNSAVNVLTGGAGNDTYVVDAGDTIVELNNGGTDTVQSAGAWTLGSNLENLTLLGTVTINGTGNSLDNVLVGNSAANTLTGGAGNDTYLVGAGDTVVESNNGGTDTVQSSVTWTLGSNVENLTLVGTVSINGTGNTLNNQLVGNSATNLLSGGTGSDTMTGGAGDDTYVVDVAGDVVTELANEGIDTVQSAITYTLSNHVENLILTGTGAINGTGNTLDNILAGNNGANVLTGGAGNDTYVVGTGDSIVENAGAGTDTVQSSITWTLGANLENLTLTGTTGINGTGNTLDNVLTGNSGANVLSGGTGNDTYVVGTGDTVTEAASAGTDTVQSSVTWTLGANLENLTLTGTTAINGTGNTDNNILTGNNANNVLTGLGGNDTYQYSRGGGQDTVVDNAGTSDRMAFGATINPLDLVISRQVNDLRMSIHGSTDQITIQNWYSGATNQTETIQAGNGKILLNTQVDQLIQAMASFSQQTGLTWDQAIDQQPQQVQNILAANWQ